MEELSKKLENIRFKSPISQIQIDSPNSIKSSKSSIKSSKSSIKSPKSSIKSPKSSIKSPKSSIKSPKSSIKSPRVSQTKISLDKLPVITHRPPQKRLEQFSKQEDYVLNLPVDYLDTLEFYIGIVGFQDFGRTTDYLHRIRNNEPLTKPQLKHFNNMKKIFNYGVAVNEEVVVLRGFTMYEKFFKMYWKSDTPISTTYDLQTAKGFGKYLMRIVLKPGNYTVVPIYVIFRAENEVLLPPGSYTLIDENEKKKEFTYVFEPDPSYLLTGEQFKVKNMMTWLTRIENVHAENEDYVKAVKKKYPKNYPSHLLRLYESMVEDKPNLEQILLTFDLDLVNLILKRYGNLINVDQEKIYSYIIDKYEIDYKDPNNFIYRSSPRLKEFITKEDIVDLYMVHYNKKEIYIDSSTSIPLYPNVKRLRLEDCKTKKLPQFPKLEVLILKFCSELTSIPYYENLQILSSNETPIESLPENLESLEVLEVINGKLTKLPLNLPSLVQLDCTRNSIYNITTYPNLAKLYCGFNKIRGISRQPRLVILHCDINELTNLPEFPKLEVLNCSNNKIKTLTDYPNLEYLNVTNNPIKELGYYPKLKKNNLLAPFALKLEYIQKMVSKKLKNK